MLVIGGVVLFATGILGNKKSTPEEVRAKFNEFAVYLQDGPEGANATENEDDQNDSEDTNEDESNYYRRAEDDWYIFNLDRYDLTDTQMLDYARELEARWQKVLDDITSDESFVINYASILKNTVNFQLLDYYKAEIIRRYAGDDGAADISKYISDLTPNTGQTGVSGMADTALRDYLLGYMTIADFYKTYGCIKDASIDETCSIELSENDNNFTTALSNLTNKYNILQTSNIVVSNSLVHYTMRLNTMFNGETE